MSKTELINKIVKKKEFSGLPKRDVKLVFEKFDNENNSDEEKIKFTRKTLRKIFSSFASRKILTLKNKDEEWILKKHLSSRERFPYYLEVYKRIFKNTTKNLSVIDLGAGVNGFSYNYFKKLGLNVNYLAIEAIKQLTDLMNHYFKDKKIPGKSLHLSLLELEKIKKIINTTKEPRVVFLFKTIDSLETLERNYSKKLISEVAPLVDLFVISFATRSMMRKRKFKVNRNWIIGFLKDNFEILDDFQTKYERYLVFRATSKHL
ncbi:MAG: hypothetical protein IIA85_03325 [Nanoarchaeota archaeon]|nr:hypothetical protein [Nanoarchaeota archaeon]